MSKRIKLKLEEEIEMLYAQLDVKEAMIKNYTAEIETQRRQLAIAVEALERYATGTDKTKESDEEGNEYEFEYPLSNDDGNTAKEALEQIKELDK